jgi:hypothetical protein
MNKVLGPDLEASLEAQDAVFGSAADYLPKSILSDREFRKAMGIGRHQQVTIHRRIGIGHWRRLFGQVRGGNLGQHHV